MSSGELQRENGRRNLRDDGELVWSSGVTMNTSGTIENKQRGYELTVNTLQYDALDNDEN